MERPGRKPAPRPPTPWCQAGRLCSVARLSRVRPPRRYRPAFTGASRTAHAHVRPSAGRDRPATVALALEHSGVGVDSGRAATLVKGGDVEMSKHSDYPAARFELTAINWTVVTNCGRRRGPAESVRGDGRRSSSGRAGGKIAPTQVGPDLPDVPGAPSDASGGHPEPVQPRQGRHHLRERGAPRSRKTWTLYSLAPG